MMLREPAGEKIKHPTALYGIGGGMSTTTSTSSAHAHKRTSNYGEDTYKSPLTLMGVPSHIKRRVGNAEDTESYQPTNTHRIQRLKLSSPTLGWILMITATAGWIGLVAAGLAFSEIPRQYLAIPIGFLLV